MLRVFQNDLLNTDDFILTLELVPGKESIGRSVDTVMGIAKDSFSDGRISAVSITDNPGGNPSLSPDVIGHEIFKVVTAIFLFYFQSFCMKSVDLEAGVFLVSVKLIMSGYKPYIVK